jgi:hypothetical protein
MVALATRSPSRSKTSAPQAKNATVVLRLLIVRLKAARKGIILLHDSQPRTAAMLPMFLRYLRENHYHVVHVEPNGPSVDFDGVP